MRFPPLEMYTLSTQGGCFMNITKVSTTLVFIAVASCGTDGLQVDTPHNDAAFEAAGAGGATPFTIHTETDLQDIPADQLPPGGGSGATDSFSGVSIVTDCETVSGQQGPLCVDLSSPYFCKARKTINKGTRVSFSFGFHHPSSSIATVTWTHTMRQEYTHKSPDCKECQLKMCYQDAKITVENCETTVTDADGEVLQQIQQTVVRKKLKDPIIFPNCDKDRPDCPGCKDTPMCDGGRGDGDTDGDDKPRDGGHTEDGDAANGNDSSQNGFMSQSAGLSASNGCGPVLSAAESSPDDSDYIEVWDSVDVDEMGTCDAASLVDARMEKESFNVHPHLFSYDPHTQDGASFDIVDVLKQCTDGL